MVTYQNGRYDNAVLCKINSKVFLYYLFCIAVRRGFHKGLSLCHVTKIMHASQMELKLLKACDFLSFCLSPVHKTSTFHTGSEAMQNEVSDLNLLFLGSNLILLAILGMICFTILWLCFMTQQLFRHSFIPFLFIIWGRSPWKSP